MFRCLFLVAMFLSASLLFSIQPMVAKVLLPVYGGTPAVWTVCMLFFQVVLLVSYGYVWVLSFFNKPIAWRTVHIVLLVFSFMLLPLVFRPVVVDGLPEWAIFYNLVTQLGLPLLIIGCSAPLLQYAYSQTQGEGAADPYFLYVASNLGSLIALLVYPWLIERFIGLSHQFQLWSLGYGLYVVLLFVILFVARYKPLARSGDAQSAWPWWDMLCWLFLSFVPCSLMLGVTSYITTDVAATPLFWVLPLALYLLTFVITFTDKPLISHVWVVRNSLFFLIFIILGFILSANQVRVWEVVLFNLLGFFVLALLCHGTLFLRRPPSQLLTLFYFCMALGGVLAGVFNGILAPHLFNQVYEYPIAILLSLLVLPFAKKTGGLWVPLLVLGILLAQYGLPAVHWIEGFTSFQLLAILALLVAVVWQSSRTSLFLSLLCLLVFIFSPDLKTNNSLLLQQRSFYAVNRVEDNQGIHIFISQSTVHGLQDMGESKPLNGYKSYYGAIKPVVDALQAQFSSLSVTVMGLGTGTMVCQFREQDQLKIIEIDQQVIDIAKNPQLFTYLRDCLPSVEIIKNDGRLAMAQIANGSQKLLVLDAFNSDAIPVHLMTLEAFNLYKSKISEDGAILINLSNRHLNLLPVVNALGRKLDLMAFYVPHKGDAKLGQLDSEWALLTANQPLAYQLMAGGGWRFLAENKQFLWTDDYSNIIPLLK
ncbi:MAG: spermidine synthase [Legionellales bacterium]